MRMRTLLATAIIGSSLLAILVLVGVDGSSDAAPAPKAAPVLVAARPLQAGALIQPQDLRWDEIASDKVPPGHIDRPLVSALKLDGPLDAIGQAHIVGAVLRHDAAAGAIIVNDEVIRPGERDFLTSVLRPNMRAISVAVNAVSGAAGLIYPGDRVDVLLTQSFTSGDLPLAKRAVGETVVEDLRVLAIDQRVQGKPEAVTADGRIARTVTLEASPSQAQKITVATELGRISLSLRSLNARPDQTPDDTGRSIWANDVSPALNALKPHAPVVKATPVAATRSVVVMRGSKVETLEHQN